MKELYKISEIAKMFNITRTALIHYDNCGLLSPSIRNEKNYRFYNSEDIKKLEFILALKESGLSLKEIQTYLIEKINKTSIELLIHQKKEIDKKIEILKTQNHIIEKRIENLNKFSTITIYDGILLDEYPHMPIIKEPIGYGPLMTYDMAINKLKNKLGQEGQLSSKFGICFDITSTNDSGKYKMKYIFDYLNIENSTQNITNIPKNKFLRCLHKGQYINIEESINKLLNYAHENGYSTLGEAYYVPLFDYWESMSDEFISEILVPVKTTSVE